MAPGSAFTPGCSTLTSATVGVMVFRADVAVERSIRPSSDSTLGLRSRFLVLNIEVPSSGSGVMGSC